MNEKINQISDKAAQAANWLKKQIAENWRLILVAAIVVIISLNSFQNEKNTEQNNQPTPSTQAEQNNSNNSENTAGTANTSENKNTEIKAGNNEDKNSIAQTAQKGDGMTQLARRAIKGYLEQGGKTLTSEQKIYAEDYVRKNTPAQKLKAGNTITFNAEVIATSVEKASTLTEKQIKNLEKFVPLAKNL